MSDSAVMLYGAAATIGAIHTLLGPDHYLPFVAMSRAGQWSLRKTLVVTLLCGVGHVLGSVLLGAVGIAAGIAMFRLEAVESARGELAGWLLLAFGLAYLVYGIRRAIRRHPHDHWHTHADGTVHTHAHVHVKDHLHVHATDEATRPPSPAGAKVAEADGGGAPAGAAWLTPWVLFTIFLFGPCEPLIPFLMYPAAKGNWVDVTMVTAAFGLTTLATMAVAVTAAHWAFRAVLWRRVERFSHALAGMVILLCGAAIKAGL